MVRSASLLFLTFGAHLALACGGTPKTAASERTAAKTPAQIEALFKREQALPELRSYKDPGGKWATRLPAVDQPRAELGDTYVQTHFSLGTEEEVQCFFYNTAIDAGQTLTKMLEGIGADVDFTHVLPYRVGSANGAPVVFVEGRYLSDSAEGKVMGSIKLGVSPRFETPVLCFLDEPGYTNSFADAVTTVLENLSVKEASEPPLFAEIWAMQLEGVPVGFRTLQVHDGGDGSVTAIALTSTFLPTGPGELATSDEVEVIQSNPSGLLKGSFLEVQGTEISHELELVRSGKSGYSVSGSFQGKEIDAEFQAPSGLSDEVSFYRYLTKNQGKKGSVTVFEFSPSIDPTSPSEVTYQVDGPARTVQHSVGNVTLKAQLGDRGLPETMSAPFGVREFKGTVIHRTGTLE